MVLPAVMVCLLILAPGILIKTHNKCYKLRKPSSSCRGFTLLELMVVIVIVGIMFSFLALSINTSSPEESIKKEAMRLDQLIELALEEAILRGEEYALVFKPDSYQFARLSENGWQLINDDRLLRPRTLPNEITLELEVEKTTLSLLDDSNDPNDSNEPEDSEDDNPDKIEPQVFLLSSGEITPEFTVSLVIFGIDQTHYVSGAMNGKLTGSYNEK